MAKQKENSADKLVNIQAAQLASQVANMAAQLEFQKERFRLLELPEMQASTQLQRDELAWKKAQGEYEKAFQEASITGTYNGQPTMEYLTNVAKMTGVLNGAQTLEGKLSDAQIAQINATIMNTQRGMDLEYEKQGFNVRQYDETHAMELQKQQASLTGYVNGLPTFEREQWQANQATSYLNLINSLRGPENAFAQLKVLRNTPDALMQMAQSWAGQFVTPTGISAPGAPPPATVMGQLNGGMSPYALPAYTPYNPMQPAQPNMSARPPAPTTEEQHIGVDTTLDKGMPQGFTPAAYNPIPATPGYSMDPAGAPAPVHAYNYAPSATGGTQVYPPGVAAPSNQLQVSTYQPVTQQTQQQMLAESTAAGQGVLPAPGQINAREYNKATGYEQALGWAQYEDQGWDKSAAQEVFKRSLPKYGVNANVQGTVRV